MAFVFEIVFLGAGVIAAVAKLGSAIAKHCSKKNK